MPPQPAQPIREYTWYREARVMETLREGYDVNKHAHRNPQQNTGRWFFDDPRVRQWRDSANSSIVWLTGQHGRGKSQLTKSLVKRGGAWWQEIESPVAPHTTVCYYFFRAGDPRRMTAYPACAGLLHQLFGYTPSGLIHKASPRWWAQTICDPWDLFEECAADNQVGQWACLLDGVDEMEPEERRVLLGEFCRVFRALSRRSQEEPRSKFKVLITSGPLQGEMMEDLKRLRAAAGADETVLFDADEKVGEIADEMKPYIEKTAKSFPEDQQPRVTRMLNENPNRCWLWTYTATNLLFTFANPKRDELPFPSSEFDNMPRDVGGVYDKALNIASAIYGARRVEYLLHIILAAKRPLSNKEVLLALEFAESDPVTAASSSTGHTYDELTETRPEWANMVDDLHGIILDMRPMLSDFVNQSARQYLIKSDDNSPSIGSSWKGRVDIRDAHATLSRITLSFLLTLKVPPSDLPGEWIEYNDNVRRMNLVKKNMAFLIYSATQWPYHYDSQPEPVAKATIESARTLCCKDGPEINSWLYLHKAPRCVQPGVITALCVGALPLAREMLEQPQDSSKHHDSLHHLPSVPVSSCCALDIAIRNGYTEIGRLLIDRGWTMHASACCENLVYWAACDGNAEAVNMLLDHGWDINVNSHGECSPLHGACSKGHREIVQILLDRGAKLHIGLKVAGNPLEAAAGNGHYEVVQILLDHGIHFRIYGIGALWSASRDGHVEIVRVLLAKGLTPNVSLSPRSGTALNVAARRGHSETVRLLVDHGARVTEDDIKAALEKGFDDIAKLLTGPYAASLLDDDLPVSMEDEIEG
ncbi:ankyrin repeat-containing domain protein [Penicillium riverlandense]|uniref:ankyrin repeat-containing domain protein n=1 Tax=Penicillium riverlandense TaxID=1903569 RepID=UPI00254905C7|nr:ankyrin repeat-containing domain protein [Penicillium riverlandense]KAJ5814816.1 ankyrin repeat-containing domain protein [Penicillium riverlandense]